VIIFAFRRRDLINAAQLECRRRWRWRQRDALLMKARNAIARCFSSMTKVFASSKFCLMKTSAGGLPFSGGEPRV